MTAITGTDLVARLKQRAAITVGNEMSRLEQFSLYIHSHPEIGGDERLASQAFAQSLDERGYSVETGICGLPTAVKATMGEGPIHAAILAEYDALPEVGHACGHNLIAAAALGSAWALADIAGDLGCTIIIDGCPSEEGGGGKIVMLEKGAFDGVTAAMMIHPWPEDRLAPKCLAVDHFRVHYHGKAAHAAAAPEHGINAADAIVIAQVAISLLRQQLHDGEQVHGIVEQGGDAPNIIPSHVISRYMVRAPDLEQLGLLRKKVDRCFEAGAVATGASLEQEMLSPTYSHMVTDPDLIRLWAGNATSLGRDYGMDERGEPPPVFSTDMGNISLAIPAIHPLLKLESGGASNHEPAFATACAGPAASKVIYDGAVAMAWTAIDLAFRTPHDPAGIAGHTAR
jgi:amidohydrolase